MIKDYDIGNDYDDDDDSIAGTLQHTWFRSEMMFSAPQPRQKAQI